MGKGKELEFPEGWGGGKGEPTVPPKRTLVESKITFCSTFEKVEKWKSGIKTRQYI
jgi:hypothetical protein